MSDEKLQFELSILNPFYSIPVSLEDWTEKIQLFLKDSLKGAETRMPWHMTSEHNSAI